MTIFNNKWVPVSLKGLSDPNFIRLGDINRIAIIPSGSESYSVNVFANGSNFIYSENSSKGDAKNSMIELFNLIES